MEPEGVALVTGASRGLGRALALELARRGFEVVASARRPEALAPLLDAAAAEGLRMRSLALDVTRAGETKLPAGLRVLVNNAGLDGPYLPVEHAAPEAWREIFETNFFGLVEVTRRAIPLLRESGGGVICNVTSASLLAPVPLFAIYRASKAAVSALGESLRAELAPFGIRVLEILPGPIATDMLAESAREPEAMDLPDYRGVAQRAQAGRRSVEGRETPPEDAARAIAAAILEDDGPLRRGCDALGSGLLSAWREQDDERLMRGMLPAFVPDE